MRPGFGTTGLTIRSSRTGFAVGLTQVTRHWVMFVAIEELTARIPRHLFGRSGKVFYSGRNAFSNSCPIYMLGINPGGSPDTHAQETVGSHTHSVLHVLPDDWSAYRDESWKGAAPGTLGMAPRVLHLLQRLGLSPGCVPASNLIFARSAREAHIERRELAAMADACWPFHEHVIEKLRPRAILCFGQTAGKYVRARLGANKVIGDFIEENNRRWRSSTFTGSAGVNVVVATHPSIADWRATATDITPLVQEALR